MVCQGCLTFHHTRKNCKRYIICGHCNETDQTNHNCTCSTIEYRHCVDHHPKIPVSVQFINTRRKSVSFKLGRRFPDKQKLLLIHWTQISWWISQKLPKHYQKPRSNLKIMQNQLKMIICEIRMATTREREIKLMMSNIKQVKIVRPPTTTVSMTTTGRKMNLTTAIIQIVECM